MTTCGSERGGVMSSKLLGEEAEEEEEAEEWSVREEENQIIAFQSTALDYVNQQHYHGLVEER